MRRVRVEGGIDGYILYVYRYRSFLWGETRGTNRRSECTSGRHPVSRCLRGNEEHGRWEGRTRDRPTGDRPAQRGALHKGAIHPRGATHTGDTQTRSSLLAAFSCAAVGRLRSTAREIGLEALEGVLHSSLRG